MFLRQKYDSNQLYENLINDKINNTNSKEQFPPNKNGKIWVLLVAGSNGWYNYRHQVLLLIISSQCFYNRYNQGSLN